jgi:DNA-binding CsgD family transcriptional regulator
MDKRAEKELVLRFRTQNKSEDEIAGLMGIKPKEVHNYIYGEPVSLSAISNEEDLVQTMWAQGKTADAIAGILDIEVCIVNEHLERLER